LNQVLRFKFELNQIFIETRYTILLPHDAL